MAAAAEFTSGSRPVSQRSASPNNPAPLRQRPHRQKWRRGAGHFGKNSPGLKVRHHFAGEHIPPPELPAVERRDNACRDVAHVAIAIGAQGCEQSPPLGDLQQHAARRRFPIERTDHEPGIYDYRLQATLDFRQHGRFGFPLGDDIRTEHAAGGWRLFIRRVLAAGQTQRIDRRNVYHPRTFAAGGLGNVAGSFHVDGPGGRHPLPADVDIGRRMHDGRKRPAWPDPPHRHRGRRLGQSRRRDHPAALSRRCRAPSPARRVPAPTACAPRCCPPVRWRR